MSSDLYLYTENGTENELLNPSEQLKWYPHHYRSED
jgi:hypothetical protein